MQLLTLEAYNVAQKKLRQTEAQAAANAKRTGTTTAKSMVAGGAQSPILQRAAKGIGDLSGTDKANLNKALKSGKHNIENMVRLFEEYSGMEIDKVRMLDQSTKQMAAKKLMTFTQKAGMQYDMMKLKFKKAVTSMQVTWGKGMAAMGRAGIKFGNVMSKVMGAAGVIGVELIDVVQILMSALKMLINIILSIMSGMENFVDFMIGMFKGLVQKLADILSCKGETQHKLLIVNLDEFFSAEKIAANFGQGLVGEGSALGDFYKDQEVGPKRIN